MHRHVSVVNTDENCHFQSYSLHFLARSRNVICDNTILFCLNVYTAHVPTYGPENDTTELLKCKDSCFVVR